MINVTKTYLPDFEEYTKYLAEIWESGWITNHGRCACELEERLKKYLGVKHVLFLSNGTVAIQIAIRALELKGEIITTPFSYVATTSSIFWEHCKPVFVDISPETLCLDPAAIEAAITERTTAILPVHVYGCPCDVEGIEEVARKHNLKLIYDAAHAFGVGYKGASILNYGDISTLSFHATKLFHTVEGGAVVTNDDALAHRLSYLRNFGHNGPEDFFGLGINGKNCEFHAAMGLCLLPKVQDIIRRRKEICEIYDTRLKGVAGIFRPALPAGVNYNYAYYPVVLRDEALLLSVRAALNKEDINPRRYFYPPLNKLNYVEHRRSPVTESVSPRVLCLPLYPELGDEQAAHIAGIVLKEVSCALKVDGAAPGGFMAMAR